MKLEISTNYNIAKDKWPYSFVSIFTTIVFTVTFFCGDILADGGIGQPVISHTRFYQADLSLPTELSFSENLYNFSESDIQAIMPFFQELLERRNEILGVKNENLASAAEIRLFQIMYVVKALDEKTLNIYDQASEVVEALREKGIELGVGEADYIALFLTESDGRHILDGAEFVTREGVIHKFDSSEGIISPAGAVSHMQIMRSSVEGAFDKKGRKIARGLNDIICDGINDPSFRGDTQEETRYFILKGMGFSEPIDWNRIVSDAEYAEKVGLAIYLIASFEINRWKVVGEGDVYGTYTAGQIREKGLDPKDFPTLGAFISGFTGIEEGALVAGAYNTGSKKVIEAMRDVLSGESLFKTGLFRETKRQIATACFFRKGIEIIVCLE